MEKRWAIQFESKAQKEELLHIGFVHDGRAIPKETVVEQGENYTAATNRSEHINTQIINWLREKERVDGVHIDYQKSDRRFTRYTTNATTEVLPDALSASSGWGTKNHYFYEINHFAGKKIELKLTVTVGTAPSSLKCLLDKIVQRFAPQMYKADWTWCCLFACPSVSISEATTDEKIKEILNEQYKKTQIFERELIAYH